MRYRFDEIADAILQLRHIANVWRWAKTQFGRTRRACTLVPIGSVTPDQVRFHHGVPLRLVGDSVTWLDRLARGYGRTMLPRHAPKNAWAVQLTDIEFREGGFLSNLGPDEAAQTEILPGDRVIVGLAPGESVSHLNSVLKKHSKRGLAKIAFVDEIAGRNCYTEHAMSVWVRPECVEIGPEEHGRPFSVVKLDVVEPDTAEGVVEEAVRWRDVVSEQPVMFGTLPDPSWLREPSRTGLLWAPMRFVSGFGSRPATGAAAALVRAALMVGVIGGSIAALTFWPGAAEPSLGTQLVVSAPAFTWLLSNIAQAAFGRRPAGPPCRRTWGRRVGLTRVALVTWRTWHGSSRRCLAIGDRLRNRGMWLDLKFRYEDAIRRELRQIWQFFGGRG